MGCTKVNAPDSECSRIPFSDSQSELPNDSIRLAYAGWLRAEPSFMPIGTRAPSYSHMGFPREFSNSSDLRQNISVECINTNYVRHERHIQTSNSIQLHEIQDNENDLS